MSSQEFFSRLLKIALENKIPLGLGLVGLAFVIYGLISLVYSPRMTDSITFQSGNRSASVSAQIIVDVEGAVEKPGIYSLPQEARVQDGLIVAGGLSESADRNWVTKNLNLATKLSDAAKVYIPREGEVTTSNPAVTLKQGLGQAGITGNVEGSGLININTASESELDGLPGVGPVTAQKIINGRPYSSIEDLLSKKIVTSKVYGQIKEKIGL